MRLMFFIFLFSFTAHAEKGMVFNYGGPIVSYEALGNAPSVYCHTQGPTTICLDTQDKRKISVDGEIFKVLGAKDWFPLSNKKIDDKKNLRITIAKNYFSSVTFKCFPPGHSPMRFEHKMDPRRGPVVELQIDCKMTDVGLAKKYMQRMVDYLFTISSPQEAGSVLESLSSEQKKLWKQVFSGLETPETLSSFLYCNIPVVANEEPVEFLGIPYTKEVDALEIEVNENCFEVPGLQGNQNICDSGRKKNGKRHGEWTIGGTGYSVVYNNGKMMSWKQCSYQNYIGFNNSKDAQDCKEGPVKDGILLVNDQTCETSSPMMGTYGQSVSSTILTFGLNCKNKKGQKEGIWLEKDGQHHIYEGGEDKQLQFGSF